MKILKVAMVSFVALGLVAMVGTASACSGEKCSASSQASYACGAKVQTASAGCGSKAQAALFAGRCGSSAKQAGAGCASGVFQAAGLNCCQQTNVRYRVALDNGDVFETFDRAKATDVANAANGAIWFVAGDQAYETEETAQVVLAADLESRINKLMTVQMMVGDQPYSCGYSAKAAAEKAHKVMAYRVAGRDFETEEAAGAFLSKVREIAAGLTIVEDRSDAPAPSYRVGERVTDSQAEAGLYLAQAKFQAIASVPATGS